MKNLKHKVIVITGAGSGIGRALALQLAKQGAIVAINDWNETTLLETADLIEQQNGFVTTSTFDVRDREQHVLFAKTIHKQFGKIDGLINNAGIGLLSYSIQHTSPSDFKRVIDVNLWGMIHATQVFLPYLLQQKEAFITNVCSILGITALMGQGAYVTAKFGTRGFTETLQQELRGTSVYVSGVYPGPIRTNIVRNINDADEETINKLASGFDGMAPISAEGAAAQIIRAIERKKKRLVITRAGKIMDLVARWFPRSYDKLIPLKFHPDNHCMVKKPNIKTTTKKTPASKTV